MEKIIYIPGTSDKQSTIDAIMTAAKSVDGKSRNRVLYTGDARDILNTLDTRPDCNTARSYSADGFVANAYKYPAEITCVDATRNDNGSYTLTVKRVGAKRSHGNGALITVDGRGI